MKVTLTRAIVERAAPPAGRPDVILWDAALRRFGLRVYASGRRVYLIQFGARDRKVTIGEHGAPWRPHPETGEPRTLTLELAREEAIRLLGALVDGRDPAEARDRARAVPTLATFAPRFDEHVDAHRAASTAREYKRLVRRLEGGPLWHLRLDRITAAQLAGVHRGMRETPREANHLVAALSVLLELARTWGEIPAGHRNPCADVERFPEGRRERALSPPELAAVGVALAEEEAAAREEIATGRGGRRSAVTLRALAAIRTILLTGARPDEILRLPRDADLSRGVVLQRAKRGAQGEARGKRPLYFAAPALEVVAAVEEVPGNPYVFAGRVAGQPLTIWGVEHVWERVRAAASRDGIDVTDARLYDLRHTFGTVAAEEHAPFVIGALMGHVSPTTTARYTHIGARPQRAASEAIAKAITDAMRARSDEDAEG